MKPRAAILSVSLALLVSACNNTTGTAPTPLPGPSKPTDPGNTADPSYPLVRIGVLVASQRSAPPQCTAAVVSGTSFSSSGRAQQTTFAGNGNVIITAAHCVEDFHGNVHSDFRFLPFWSGYNPRWSEDLDSMTVKDFVYMHWPTAEPLITPPYGIWRTSQPPIINPAYINSKIQGGVDERYDYAFLVMDEDGNGKPVEGHTLESVLHGGLPLAFNPPDKQTWTMSSYDACYASHKSCDQYAGWRPPGLHQCRGLSTAQGNPPWNLLLKGTDGTGANIGCENGAFGSGSPWINQKNGFPFAIGSVALRSIVPGEKDWPTEYVSPCCGQFGAYLGDDAITLWERAEGIPGSSHGLGPSPTAQPTSASPTANSVASPSPSVTAQSSLPSTYVGAWSGTFNQTIPPIGSFQMTVTLHPGSTGAEVGQGFYARDQIVCRPTLTLQSSDGQTVTLAEHGLSLPCLGGTFTFQLSNRTLTATWRTPTGQVGGNITLTPSGSVLPDAYVGTWTGTFNQTVPQTGSFQMTMTLHAGSLGTEVGQATYTHGQLACTPKLTLLRADGQAVALYELGLSTPCLGGTFTFQLTNQTLTGTWHTPSGQVGGNITLTKVH